MTEPTDEMADWAGETGCSMEGLRYAHKPDERVATELRTAFVRALREAGQETATGETFDVRLGDGRARFWFGRQWLTIDWDGTEQDLIDLARYFAQSLREETEE